MITDEQLLKWLKSEGAKTTAEIREYIKDTDESPRTNYTPHFYLNNVYNRMKRMEKRGLVKLVGRTHKDGNYWSVVE